MDQSNVSNHSNGDYNEGQNTDGNIENIVNVQWNISWQCLIVDTFDTHFDTEFAEEIDKMIKFPVQIFKEEFCKKSRNLTQINLTLFLIWENYQTSFSYIFCIPIQPFYAILHHWDEVELNQLLSRLLLYHLYHSYTWHSPLQV